MYVVSVDNTVGVPLITPVDESIVMPVGRSGEISHEVTEPPSDAGVTGVIGIPLVSTNELGVYSTSDGMTSLTSIVIVILSLPPEFVAVIVYVPDGVITVGVPLIVPVAASIERPVGRPGFTDHVTTGPPPEVGVTGVISASSVKMNELGV